MRLRTVILALFALLAPVALAQEADDVQTGTNADGETICYQRANNKASLLTSMGMVKSPSSLYVVVSHQMNDRRFDADFSLYGPKGGEKVTFMIGNKVITAVPDKVNSDLYSEDAYFYNAQLARTLLAAPGNIWVHFIGPQRTIQFTLEPNILRILRSGFGQICLGSP